MMIPHDVQTAVEASGGIAYEVRRPLVEPYTWLACWLAGAWHAAEYGADIQVRPVEVAS